MGRANALLSGSPGGVLRLIRDGRAGTRTEVMDVTGLSRSTVMQRLGVLLSAGLLLEEPEAGRSSGGRRPAALSFNERVGVVLAADLGALHGRLAVCDLAGVTLAERAEPIRIADGPEPVLDWVGRTFDALLAEAGRGRADVLASAIGVPGPVEVATGRPMNPPLMPGWDGYGVADNLRERFGAPALLERDVHAMALGEHRRHRRELSHMVFVKIATGIGAGIISDGELLRGNHGRAGDIGHIRAIRQSDVMCTCGNRGCVAVLASAAAVIRQLGEAGIEVDSTAGVVELVGGRRDRDAPRARGRPRARRRAGRRGQRRGADRDRRRRRAGRRVGAAARRHPRERLPARVGAAPRASCGSTRAASARARAWSGRRRSRSSTCSSRPTSTRCSPRAASRRDRAARARRRDPRRPGEPRPGRHGRRQARLRAGGGLRRARAARRRPAAPGSSRRAAAACRASARSSTAGSATSTPARAGARSTGCVVSSTASRRSAAEA